MAQGDRAWIPISPPGLMNAIAEDANPSVQDVDKFHQQIKEQEDQDPGL